MLNNKWLKRFSELCKTVSLWSEDTSTKVGAVIVSDQNDILTVGWNGLPRGVKLTPERLERPKKYRFFEHAERNAIYNAARKQVSIENATIIVNYFPCCDCARAIIQSGIKTVYYSGTISSEEWEQSNKASREMLSEAGVDYIHFGNNKDFTAMEVLAVNDELVSSSFNPNCEPKDASL